MYHGRRKLRKVNVRHISGAENIYINENLTAQRAALFKKVRDKKRWREGWKVWTTDGKKICLIRFNFGLYSQEKQCRRPGKNCRCFSFSISSIELPHIFFLILALFYCPYCSFVHYKSSVYVLCFFFFFPLAAAIVSIIISPWVSVLCCIFVLDYG